MIYQSTAEDDCIYTGVDLIETVDGVYQGITSGGNPVNTSDFDGWIIGIQNPDGEMLFENLIMRSCYRLVMSFLMPS